jgi:hypothetical protein
VTGTVDTSCDPAGWRAGAAYDTRALRTVPGRRLASRFAFGAVAAGSVVLQLLVTDVRRAPSWDEAIYLSQAWRAAPALPFAPSRARGIVLLVAPASWTSGSVTLSRVFMMVGAAALLAWAYGAWAPVVGRGASILAAVVFATWWVAIYYGAAVMPNLWSALLGVALVAWTVRGAGSRRARLCAAAAGAAMALVRPPDALVLLAALALSTAFARSLRGRALLWPAAGIAAGVFAWLVEMSVRFGGPTAAARGALTVSHVSALSLPQRLLQQLAASDGPTLGPVAHPTVPLFGALWWAALIALTSAGVLSARHAETREPILVATLGGASLLVVYVVLISGIAPRFLFPAVGLLALPTGTGIVRVLRSRRGPALVGLAAVLMPLLVWNLRTAAQVSRDDGAAQSRARAVGQAIRRAADGRPCAVSSTDAYPEVAFAAGCFGAPAVSGEVRSPTVTAWIREGRATFLVTHGSVRRLSPSPPPLAP